MSAIKARPRGRPLVVLLAVLALWVGARALLWETPFAPSQAQANMASRPIDREPQADTPASQDFGADPAQENPAIPAARRGLLPQLQDRPAPWLRPAVPTRPAVMAPVEGLPTPADAPGVGTRKLAPADATAVRSRAAGAHQMMFLAAMAHLPVPQDVEDEMVRAGEVGPLPQSSAARQDRWSLDAWALWRQGSGVSAISQGRVPSYGASQAGAVLRYRLAAHGRNDPRAYVRAYRALISGGESELAPGLSARPLAGVPLRAHAELRVTDRRGGTDLRPAVLVTTELSPHALPAGMRAEMYVQGGYVGGKYDTAFADGQLYLLRDVKQFDLGRLSLGAGLWAGAQKGAARTDVGPTLRLDLDIGYVPARLAVDYRARVAGRAEPGSGAAVTLSTRF